MIDWLAEYLDWDPLDYIAKQYITRDPVRFAAQYRRAVRNGLPGLADYYGRRCGLPMGPTGPKLKHRRKQ